MATDPINVDVDAMLNAAREFEDKHDNIRGQVTSLQGELRGHRTAGDRGIAVVLPGPLTPSAETLTRLVALETSVSRI